MSMRIANTACELGLLLTLTLNLVACGGGGGGGGQQQNQNQTIAFTTPGPVNGTVGTTFTNTAGGGGGSGVVTYTSGNLSVAIVDASTGVATLLSAGSATITATKAASTGFNQATAAYVLNVSTGTQSIAFAQAGAAQLLKGLSLTNAAAGGAGSGSISYSSSDTAIATVTNAGRVTGVSAGTVTITATKAADANYGQAQASYTLSVQSSTPVTAWVGANDSQVSFAAAANQLQFIRSTARNCDIANYSACTNGQLSFVQSGAITDTAASHSSTAYYWLRDGNNLATPALPVSTRKFSARIGHTSVFYNNRYWVIGGALGQSSSQARADVWSSIDGKTWELETSNAAFGARWFHQSVVFDGKMWVIGGISSTNALSLSSWYSTDGITWTQAGAVPFNTMTHENLNVVVFKNELWAVFNGGAYSSATGASWTLRSAANAIDAGLARGLATLSVFNGSLWYVGGARGYTAAAGTGTAANDIWSSSDGVTWTRVVANASFGARWRHTSFVFNGRLWVFGGENVTAGVVSAGPQDAWSSSDGLSWTKETLSSGIARGSFLPIVSDGTKLTMIGGSMRSITNEVWQSTDGRTWSPLSSLAQFSARASHTVEFLGDIWLVGGSVADNATSNELWRSSDGMNWTLVNATGPKFSPRTSHAVAIFNNRLWVISGWDESTIAGGTETRLNDVWSSADGVNWTQHVPGNALFNPRLGAAAVVFNGKLWMIGGSTATNTYVNDVWSTSDGSNWTLEAGAPAFAARAAHTVTSFAGKLWLIGGQNAAGTFGDIWQSSDGISWSSVVPPVAAFAARSEHGVIVHNNRMWLTGGWNGLTWAASGNPFNYFTATRFEDVWSSADGISWRVETAIAPFGPRAAPGFVSHNNELWTIGGINYERLGDVWRSPDGVAWRVGFTNNLQSP